VERNTFHQQIKVAMPHDTVESKGQLGSGNAPTLSIRKHGRCGTGNRLSSVVRNAVGFENYSPPLKPKQGVVS